MNTYADVIAGIESAGSGDYGAVGPKTRDGDYAYGRYGVMGANLPKWTKKYVGRELTPTEFLRDSDAQDAVFEGQFGSYLNKYGNPQDAASAWFTGGPRATGANKRDILGTSGAEYVNKFNAALGQDSQKQEQIAALLGMTGAGAMPGAMPGAMMPPNTGAPAGAMPNPFELLEKIQESPLEAALFLRSLPQFAPGTPVQVGERTLVPVEGNPFEA